MRIGVLSDTHINAPDQRLSAEILNVLDGVDIILHAGDLTDISVYRQLSELAKTYVVSGNMDSEEVKKSFPRKKIVSAGSFRLGMVHGDPMRRYDPSVLRDFFRKDKVDVIVFGHLHKQVNTKEDGIIFFNPGSALDTFYTDTRSMGLIEIDGGIETTIIGLS